ncbi:MAG: hypothetical protein RLZ86_91 [Actinomycetota bacterium]
MIPDHSHRSLDELWRLDGRRAVVTGGARGIGAQIARRLSEAGASVLLADLDPVEAERTATEIRSATGRPTSAIGLDVSKTASIATAADRAVELWQGIDIWVNNAGIFPTTGPAIDATDEFLDRVMSVNVRGTYAGAREAARRMESGGVIVNLASTTGFRAAPGISAYSISKHAVVGATRALALEFASRDIRVVAVAPGPIATPGVDEQMAPLKAAGLDVAAVMARNPLGRGGVPDDVARVVTFLASDMATWITGEIVVVDAGSLAG